MRRLPIDPYLFAMAATVALASLFPAEGQGAVTINWVVKIAIAFLFFLYGARLSPQAAFEGLKHWRLHLVVLAATFVLFPLLGVVAAVLVPHLLPPQLYAGLLFLCILPSTVQSSIAFTSIARGNVAAALCAASASNIAGIFITPLLVALLMKTNAGFSFSVLLDIVLQLLAPFIAGQLLRPLIGAFVVRHKNGLGYVDRGSILLVIYAAFSEGIVNGVWHTVTLNELLALGAASALLLGAILALTVTISRMLKFTKEDEIVIVFCGSKKSLASGLPMASVLFPVAQVGLIVLPLMLFHQLQLMVCAFLAQRYAARQNPAGEAVPVAISTAPDLIGD